MAVFLPPSIWFICQEFSRHNSKAYPIKDWLIMQSYFHIQTVQAGNDHQLTDANIICWYRNVPVHTWSPHVCSVMCIIKVWRICYITNILSYSKPQDYAIVCVLLCLLWFIIDKFTHITARCRYNTVIFFQYPHNRHPIARPSGRGMGCLLWVSSLIHVLLMSLKFCVCYCDKLDRVITALDCIY